MPYFAYVEGAELQTVRKEACHQLLKQIFPDAEDYETIKKEVSKADATARLDAIKRQKVEVNRIAWCWFWVAGYGIWKQSQSGVVQGWELVAGLGQGCLHSAGDQGEECSALWVRDSVHPPFVSWMGLLEDTCCQFFCCCIL